MITTIVFLITQPTLGFSGTGLGCKDKFQGRVLKVKDVYQSEFPKVEVSFSVEEVEKGNPSSSRSILILKDGPMNFEVGSLYEVQMNGKWLCDSKKL